jgi:hypothetical protein
MRRLEEWTNFTPFALDFLLLLFLLDAALPFIFKPFEDEVASSAYFLAHCISGHLTEIILFPSTSSFSGTLLKAAFLFTIVCLNAEQSSVADRLCIAALFLILLGL